MHKQYKRKYKDLCNNPSCALLISFACRDYFGFGYSVHIVLKHAYQWDEISDNFCDVLISGQAFEHIEFPWITISEIARILKPNGLICIIAPSMARLHRYPVHCQNYFSDGLIALAKFAGLKVIHASTNLAPIGATIDWYGGIDEDFCEDSMLVARKPPDWKPNNFDKLSYICEPADLTKMATSLVPEGRIRKFLRNKCKNTMPAWI
jgi:SAM-dependent methyltransferase